MNITRYSPALSEQWNDFVARSCNATFLLDRRFMDYHADRFSDCSLLFYDHNKLVAVLPASVSGTTLTSHAGLTYGGLVVADDTTATASIECMRALTAYCQAQGLTRIVIKPIPYIYTSQPSEAYRYAMFLQGYTLTACGLSMAVNMRQRPKMRTLRVRGCRKAQKNNLRIVEGIEHIEGFHEVLTQVLAARHSVTPVHSADEMRLLASRFPDNTRLLTVWRDDELVGGTWLFVTKSVAHAQYIAASDNGTSLGALDLLFVSLLDTLQTDWLDFGVCTERDCRSLNTGLLFQKEGFGARPVVYEQWENVIVGNLLREPQ